MTDNFHDVFHIIEYARQDSMGRLHSWSFGGIARNDEEERRIRNDLIQSNAPNITIVRSHKYSHAIGSNA
jgi:hypothetical protein